MGSYTFKWEHPAQEVYVTGTFDNWQKSVRLEHNGSHFEKTVDLPSHDRILYKFVTDGHWTADYNKYNENDGSGNVNNVLFQHDLVPSSSSHGQSQEEHSHMPGEFPETPAVDSAAFGINPLPAFPGMGNPTNISAGQSLPHHSNFTSESIGSNVKLDKDSYERSDAYPTSSSVSGIPEIGTFGVPPVSRNMIPESSLPMGEGSRGYETDVSPHMQSAGAGTSTADLAGQVPLEPRGVPQVVHDSQREAHQGPEAAGNAEALSDKSQLEQELLSKVSTAHGVNDSASDFVAGGSVPQAVQHSQLVAQQDPEAAANPEAVNEKSAMESELLQRVPTAQASDAYRNEPVSAVPDVVAESQYAAGQGPEAAGNPEAVSEKSQVEQELLSKVPTQNTSSDTGAGKVADYAATGAAAVGLTGVAAAIGHRMQGQSTTTSSIPSTGDISQKASETYQSAATTAQSTYQDAARNMPSSTQEAHAQLPTSVQNATANLPSSSQAATSSLPAIPVIFKTALDQASNAVGNLTGANKTADNVPETVQHSIQQQFTRGPEAAVNPEAVSEKSAVERELLASIRPAQETGEHAPSYGTTQTTSAPSSSSMATGSTIPEAVQHSIADSSRGPEAAANPEAVSDKRQVERELLSSVNTSQETGEHAPTYSAVPSASEATGKAAEYAAAGAAAVGLTGVAAAIHRNAGTSSSAPTQQTSSYNGATSSIPSYDSLPSASEVSNRAYNAVPSATQTGDMAAEYAASGAAAVGLTGVASTIRNNAPSSTYATQSSNTTSSIPSYDSLPSASEASNRAYNAVPSATQAGNTAAEYAASGAAAVGLGGVANSIRNNVPSSTYATQSSNTNSSVPEAVQDSFAQSSRGPEAAANPEAVSEKSQVERELLSAVHKTNESSEPAPTTSAALSATGPGLTSSSADNRAPEDFARNAPSSGMPLASPQLYDQDTAPAIAAMSQDLNLSERPPRTSSRAYEAPATSSSASSAYTSTTPPPAQNYTTRDQSIIDRVFGAPVDGGASPSYSSSAAPLAAGAGAGALGGAVTAGVAREVEQRKTTTQSSTASSSAPLSSYGHIKNETYGGSSAAFKHDPVSAGSAPISTAMASDPRSVASAFANDPISPAAAKSTSTTAAPTSQSRSNPAAIAAATAAGTGAAGIAAASASKSSGLNASASTPAQTPATKVAASSATSSQKPAGGAMASAMQQSRQESRDVSPMGGKQTALQESPVVTSGVATHSTPAKSTPAQSQTPTSTPMKSNTATTPSSSASTPSKAAPASGPRLDIPSGESSDKSKKRRSFFGKIKDRMAGHNENEICGETSTEDEQDDSAYHSEDDTANGSNKMSTILQQRDGIDEQQEDNLAKQDITISAESEKEKTVVEEIAAVAASGKRTVSSKNGAAFVAACVVAGVAIVLVWR